MSSMAGEKFDLDRGIGDLEGIFHNQGISDLSWLSVTEEDYKAAETLPKQNLDIIPDLQKALFEDKDGVPRLIPMKPHVIVNQNPSDSPHIVPKDETSPIRNRLAHYIMSNRSFDEITQLISLEFSQSSLRMASKEITHLMGERGLLGNVYIDASCFPRCATDSKEQSFVQKNGKRALYVLAKESCSDCVNNKSGFCSVLGSKRIVNEVPYGTQLAAHYAPQLSSELRPLDFGVSGWKQRVKTAFLKSPISSRSDGIQTAMTQHKVASPAITNAHIDEFVNRPAVQANRVSSSYSKFATRMMFGHDDREFLIASGDKELLSLASEFGLLGHSWLDMDAIGGCKPTLAFIRRRADSGLSSIFPDFVLRRSSCEFCKNVSGGCCSEISKVSTIIDELPKYNRISFAKSLLRSVRNGVISNDEAKLAVSRSASLKNPNWRSLIASINMKKPEKSPTPSYSNTRAKAFTGVSTTVERIIDPNEVRNFISKAMNSGLSGEELKSSILKVWTRDELSSVPQVAKIASYSGIQGTHFLDPTAYGDYGSGCNEGSSLLKKKDVPLVLASSRCTGCTLQTSPGWCSKYAKGLLRSIPDSIMASMKVTRASSKIHTASAVKSSDPVSDFDISKPDIEISSSGFDSDFSISVSSPNIDI